MELYRASQKVLCADGGANRLYDSFEEPERSEHLPGMIVGDLDSIRPEVKTYYSEKGVSVHKEYDQDRNDLEKTLKFALRNEDSDAAAKFFKDGEGNISRELSNKIIIYGAFGGRMDQTLSSLHVLMHMS